MVITPGAIIAAKSYIPINAFLSMFQSRRSIWHNCCRGQVLQREMGLRCAVQGASIIQLEGDKIRSDNACFDSKAQKECFRLEIRSMSIQALKQSLPELSDEAFERRYRQFFLKALAPVLGYEVSRRGESWDEILDCF